MGNGLGIAVVHRDDDITRRVREFLSRQHFPVFETIEISVCDGVLTIYGHLDSFYEKQVAMTICQHVPGVRQLVDQLEVAGYAERYTDLIENGSRQ